MNPHGHDVHVSNESEVRFPNSRSPSPSSPSTLTTGTTTSTSNTLPSTPGSTLSNSHTFNLKKLDNALKSKNNQVQAAQTLVHNTAAGPEWLIDPYTDWVCAFGYDGRLDTPAVVPEKVSDFITVLKDELHTIHGVQQGLRSYIRAIASGEYHTFDDKFLTHETNATDITVSQLQQIASNLGDIIQAVEAQQASTSHGLVGMEYKQAYRYAQPWIIRARANLVSAHVFYKINFVLGSDKHKSFH